MNIGKESFWKPRNNTNQNVLKVVEVSHERFEVLGSDGFHNVTSLDTLVSALKGEIGSKTIWVECSEDDFKKDRILRELRDS